MMPRVSSQGYAFIKCHGHHRSNKQGYVKLADLVAEHKIGRHLRENEVVHHIDHDRLNDSPDNLQIMDKVEHDRMETNNRWSNGTINGFLKSV